MEFSLKFFYERFTEYKSGTSILQDRLRHCENRSRPGVNEVNAGE